jgi:Ras-related protein Rab-23
MSAAEVKVIIIGNGGVGKSSMMRRFCKVSRTARCTVEWDRGLNLAVLPAHLSQSEFTGEYKKTIGTDFMRKEIYLDSISEEVCAP